MPSLVLAVKFLSQALAVVIVVLNILMKSSTNPLRHPAEGIVVTFLVNSLGQFGLKKSLLRSNLSRHPFSSLLVHVLSLPIALSLSTVINKSHCHYTITE